MAINISEARVRVTAETTGEERLRKLREEMQQLTKETGQYNAANNNGAKSDAVRRQSMIQLGQQIGDVGVQLQMGTSAARVFAMQSGQVGFALAGMGGVLGRVGGFLAGPWGAALTVAVSTLGMFAEQLAQTSENTSKLELASTGLAEAQGVLGEMFDLTTGKLKSQNEILRLNVQLMAIKLRAEATTGDEQVAAARKDSGQYSWGALWRKNIPLRNMTDERNTQARARLDAVINAKNPEEAARAGREAAKWAETANFDDVDINRSDFIGAITSAVSGRAKRLTAEQLERALDGKLPAMFLRPSNRRPRRERQNKADPFGDAMTQIGGDREQMEFQIAALNKYGERLASTKAVLVEWNIEHGKYGKLSEDQKKALMDEARAYDTAADKLKRLTAEKKQEGEIDKAKIGWRQQLEAVQDEPLQMTMTALAYKQLVDRKRELAAIDEKIVDWEPKTAAAYREAAIAALDQRQAIERLNDEKSKTFGSGQARAIKEYGEEIGNYGQQAFEMWTSGLRATEDAMVNFFMTGKLGFKDLVNSMIADLVRFAVRRAILAPIMTMLGALAPGGSKFGNNAMGGLKAANGAAFGMGGVRMFADGGIVTNPTLFGYGGGIGMMGEAGAEAVMPLKRLSNGKLGVMAEGGTNNVVVNVNVEGGNSQVSGDQGKAAQLGNLIAGVVRNELVAQKRPGGILAAS